MQVRDVMTRGVIGVAEDTGVDEAIETMLRSRVSALLMFDAKHELAGILSEGDLLRRGELGSEHKRPGWLDFLLGSGRLAETYAHEFGRKVGEVMTRDVETINRPRSSAGTSTGWSGAARALAGAAGRQCRRRGLALGSAQGALGRDAASEGRAS